MTSDQLDLLIGLTGMDKETFCSTTTIPAGIPILWRMLGVFDGKIRIVRDGSIGSYSYDTSVEDVNSGYGINEWSQADLMKLLNPGFDNNYDKINVHWNSETEQYDYNTELVNNSLWWNSKSGICYNNYDNQVTSCDFTSSGLSEEAKKFVVDQTLYLGGFDTKNLFANQAYINERGSNVFNSSKISDCLEISGMFLCNDTVTRTLSWTGKVGLIYPSDVAYAANLSNSNCKETIDNFDSCTENWMNKGSLWTVTSLPEGDYASFSQIHIVNGSAEGPIADIDGFLPDDYGVRPVLTLNPNVFKLSGTGTKDDPFVIGDEPKYTATINYYGEDGKLLDIDNNPYVIDNLSSGYTDTIKPPKVSGCYAKNINISITDKDEVYDVYYNCSVIVNPKTGRLLMILGIVFGIASISYLVYYMKRKR